MPPKPRENAAGAPASFEAGLEQLEQIVRELERGDLALEDSIALFEKGVTLSDACRKQLEDAETKVEVLRRQGSSRNSEAATATDSRSDEKTSGRASIASAQSDSGLDDDDDTPF